VLISSAIAISRGRLDGDAASGTAGSVGIIFQSPERHFVGDTVADELGFGWKHAADPAVRSLQRLPGVLRATGLSQIPFDSRLGELSGGYQRRVAIAVQLLRNPAVLMLDEPTAGLDLASCKALLATLVAAKASTAILVTSHDEEIERIADCVWEMKTGGYMHAKH